MHAALQLDGLTRDFRSGFWLRRRRVLGPIDLRVERGGAVGLMGPNGSGKSTLLRLAAGVDRPTLGQVAVFGLDPFESAGRERVGLLAEGFPYPQELPGRSVLDLVARLRGVGATRRERMGAVDAWLARVGLTADGRRASGRYSTGMRRRLTLACALVHAPKLLLLDEPGAGLDAEGFAVLDEVLSESQSRGAALVLCSHHGSELFRHTRQLLVLIGGAPAWSGATDELAVRARRLELEIEVDAQGRDVRDGLAQRLEEVGARLVSARPASAATARLYTELARERESRG